MKTFGSELHVVSFAFFKKKRNLKNIVDDIRLK